MIEIKYYNDSLYVELIKVLQECDLYTETWETRENLKRKIEKDSESILVAFDEEKVIGCVFIVEDGWNGFIWRLAVKEKYRRQGIGSMLLQKAEEIIKAREIKESSMFVDPKNEHLQNWYKKQNYLQGRNWTFMYKKL
ncbi:MAG: GNAT family N-acetyltransferase [Candidatus Nanoarchaeia archaeon]